MMYIMMLLIMTRSGRTESAKILLKRGAQLQAKDLKGLTALHHAARNYQVSCQRSSEPK